MPFIYPLDQAKVEYPEYKFLAALTPSEQKAAFHVQDAAGIHLCLKIIAPRYDIDRLNREIRALNTINHPNVARLKEYVLISNSSQSRHHLVEEYIDGDDLGASLMGTWDISEALAFYSRLSDGLEELRKASVVHRDLKPSNIRRRRSDGSPVIVDFGVARHLDLPDLTMTNQGAEIGTPLYFAPEQFNGTKNDIDHRTDLFALGILLYQTVCGEHPFWPSSGTVSMDQFRNNLCTSDNAVATAKFRSLPRGLQLIIGKLLAKQRGGRPQSAALVATLLRNPKILV